MAATVTRGNRKDQSAITVAVNGRDLGVWEDKDGGEIDSDSNPIYPGARKAPVDLGGKQIPGAITLTRTFDLDRDQPELQYLMNQAGKGRVTVKDQPLDADDNAFGSPLVQTGKLKTVTPPSRSSSDSSAAQVAIVVSTDGAVA